MGLDPKEEHTFCMPLLDAVLMGNLLHVGAQACCNSIQAYTLPLVALQVTHTVNNQGSVRDTDRIRHGCCSCRGLHHFA